MPSRSSHQKCTHKWSRQWRVSDPEHSNDQQTTADRMSFNQGGERCRVEKEEVLRHVLSLRHILLLGDKTYQIWCTACTFCHCGTFCHYVVTKRAERSTRCTLSLLRQQHYNLSFPSLVVCVCVCVCAFVRGSARPPACKLLCIVFIIPASISAKLKFCIALSRLRGYCCP